MNNPSDIVTIWWVNVYKVGTEAPSLGHLHKTEREAEKIGKGKKGYQRTIPIAVEGK